MSPNSGSAAKPRSFNIWLDSVIYQRSSNLCVGLDPDCARITEITGHPEILSEDLCVKAMFTAASAAAGYCAAFKPNAAFFEALEEDSPLMAKVGNRLVDSYPGIIALCDAKRGDIGNTSLQYAEAIFRRQRFHAVTVSPLMGYDSVEPFTRDNTRGAFLLCLTSNPGAEDFLLKNDLYLRIAEKAVEWNKNDNVGLVVGATHPEYLAKVREVAPELPLLIPGVGTQGGKLGETLDAIGAKANRRFLINASRSILYPAGATWANYADLVSAAAKELRNEINQHLGE